MSDKHGGSVPINPSGFSGKQPLNIGSSKELKVALSLPFDDFCSTYQAPPLKQEDYLDVRNVPELWWHVISNFPVSHIFLYSYGLASIDSNLRGLSEARVAAYSKCDETANEAGLLWLAMRPWYKMLMVTARRRKQVPAWCEQVKGWMSQLASDRGLLSSRLILIEYSIKAVLGSSANLSTWRPVLEQEAANWDQWLTDEKSKISDFFSFI